MTEKQKATAWDTLKLGLSRMISDQSKSSECREMSAEFLSMMTELELTVENGRR
jgi:hypothetical protein